MPRSRQSSTRAKAGIHFIIADPSSSRERPDNLRIVRSHVGRWRWQQAKQNLQQESPQTIGADKSSTVGSTHYYRSSESKINELSTGEISGDLETDADIFPFLVPELVVPDESYHGHDLPDDDVFASSNQESHTAMPDIWVEQDGAGDVALSPSMSLIGISPEILDPFQTIGASPLSLSLVSNSNKYCTSRSTSILISLQLTCSHKPCQSYGPV